MRFIKRIILSCILLYTYDLLAIYVNMIIPINLLTVFIVSLLGIPGFFMLVFFKVFL